MRRVKIIANAHNTAAINANPIASDGGAWNGSLATTTPTNPSATLIHCVRDTRSPNTGPAMPVIINGAAK